MADDVENVSAVPTAYMTPQQLQAAYLDVLRGKNKLQAAPAYNLWEAGAQLLNNFGDIMQMRRLMQQSRGIQQSNAALAFPGAGGGGATSSPAASSAPQPSQPADTSAAPDVSDRSVPASIRNNNPGAQWPGESATKFGATGSQDLPGGQKIATFPDPVSGAAAQYDLMDRRYTGMTLRQAIGKWSGGHSPDEYTQVVAQRTGLSPDTVITKDLLRDPKVAVPLGQAMAYHEAGRPYPLTPEQWTQAHRMAFNGQPAAPAAGPAPGGAAPAGAPAATTAAPGGDSFAPRPMTYPNPAELPTRPQRNWAEIQRRWPTMSPQDQEMYRKEFEATNGGKNPMSFEIKGAGNYVYNPANPGQGMFHPFVHIEKSKDTAGNEREFEYVLDPKTNERIYRGGVAPPTAEESIAGAAQLAGAKKGAEEQAGGRAKYYDSLYRGFTGSGVIAAQQKQNIRDLRTVAESPDFTSGAWSESKLALKRMAANFGIDPGGATPRELFNTLAARVLADQFSGMRSMSSETGEQGSRVFKSMLDIEEKANITPEDSPKGILAKLNMVDRAGDKMLDYARDTIDYRKKYGRLDEDFEKQMMDKISTSAGNIREGDVRGPEGKASPAAPGEVNTRTIGGKTYYQRGGKWFTE